VPRLVLAPHERFPQDEVPLARGDDAARPVVAEILRMDPFDGEGITELSRRVVTCGTDVRDHWTQDLQEVDIALVVGALANPRHDAGTPPNLALGLRPTARASPSSPAASSPAAPTCGTTGRAASSPRASG
jgi:hypothetical protein